MLDALRRGLGDRYRIGGELGAGGMATVFEATDLRHHRSVAIKVLQPAVARVLGMDRFRREIETTAGLTHPHIVPIFDSGAVELDHGETGLYYVMPLIPGRSLRERLQTEPQLPVDEALTICRDVGAALQHAHGRGLIHRDVKPENILLVDGQAVLTDFGIAKPVESAERSALTSTGVTLGTPAYMSPEQRVSGGEVDARSDQYALAMVLYEMLAGEQPFRAATPQAAAARQLAGEVPRLRTVRPTVPEAVDLAAHRALAVMAVDRYPSVEAFLAALTPRGRSAPASRRGSPRAWIGVTIAVVVVAVAIATFLLRGGASAGPDDRLGLALMPFRGTGIGADWGETLPDLVATTLTGTPGLRIVDPWGLWEPLRSSPGSRARSPDRAEAERLALRSGASRFVLGSLAGTSGSLELNVRVYATAKADPIDAFTLSSPADSAVALGRRVALELITRLGGAGPSERNLEAPTASPQALKAYLAAREAMRRGDPDSANTAISRALSLDSTFTLALVEAVTIRSWAQTMRGFQYQGLRELIERAQADSARLPLKIRLGLRATDASIETDGPAAAAAWRKIIEFDSTNVHAWNGLAYVSRVYGWQFGMTPDRLLEIVDRAYRLDSSYVPALLNRTSLVSVRGDSAEARVDLERLRRSSSPSPLIAASRWSLEGLLASDSVFPALADSVAATPPLVWGNVVRLLRSWRPDRALSLTRRLRRVATPGFAFNFAANAEAGLLLGIGRLRAVDSIRTSGAYTGAPGLDQVVDWSLLSAALIGMSDSATTRGALRRRTADLPRDSALALLNERPVWFGGWLLAAYHATFGDTAEARAWIAAMDGFPHEGSPREWAAAEQADIASRLAERGGRFESAATLAERAYALWTIHTENVAGYWPEPAIRFHLAETLRDRGLADSAAAIFASLTPPVTWIPAFTPRALYELGLLAERRGDPQAAVRQFDHALQFWELGGPEVALWRDRALAGVRRNAGEAGAAPRVRPPNA
jgi:serine/threonine protein kinase